MLNNYDNSSNTASLKLRAQKLIATANEILAIARELDNWINIHEGLENCSSSESKIAIDDDPIWVELAHQAYRDREMRASIFKDTSLFGEPAWDILLDLFISAKKHQRVSITSACIGSRVPLTTALRWIALLEEKGMVTRFADVVDARRSFVRLTADAYAMMTAYFRSCSRSVRNDIGIREFPPSERMTSLAA